MRNSKGKEVMSRAPFPAAAALAAALAAPCVSAVSLNPHGLGEVLVYPYYTVNKNQDTLITIGNSTPVSKVVAVVIREGMNGRPVLYFTLFLSPHDAWTARISGTGGEGGAFLITQDSSCTSPGLSEGGMRFWSETYAGPARPADGGPTGIERTREGMIEFIELGHAIPGSALARTIEHVPTGHPNDGVPECDTEALGLRNATNAGPPGGGLFGTASIVNVAEGTYFGYQADALAGFSDVVLPPKDYMPIPFERMLAFANSSDSSVGGAKATVIERDGRAVDLDYARGIDAVSAVFMAESLVNEYLVSPALGANTDWVVSFPTRTFLVDSFYAAAQVPSPPFTQSAVAARSDAFVHPAIYDQEASQCPSCAVSPPIGPPPMLKWQVNVVSFLPDGTPNAPSPVLGSNLTTRLAPFGDAGLAVLSLGSHTGQELPGGRGNGYAATLHGLPVAGFMVYNIINANAAPGRLANYGGAFAHRTTMLCVAQAQDGGSASCVTGVVQR